MATTSAPSNGGLGTKKSVFVLITVVGCIAILWPKILYFAMFGGQQTNKVFIKDHRSGTGELIYGKILPDHFSGKNVG